jgi:hypothetical protein
MIPNCGKSRLLYLVSFFSCQLPALKIGQILKMKQVGFVNEKSFFVTVQYKYITTIFTTNLTCFKNRSKIEDETSWFF